MDDLFIEKHRLAFVLGDKYYKVVELARQMEIVKAFFEQCQTMLIDITKESISIKDSINKEYNEYISTRQQWERLKHGR